MYGSAWLRCAEADAETRLVSACVRTEVVLTVAVDMAPAKVGRRPEQQPTSSLSKPQPPERLRSLLRQQQTLLSKIKQEQRARERLIERVRQAESVMAHKLEPLAREQAALVEQFHQLFQEVLQTPGRARSTQRALLTWYVDLCLGMGELPRIGLNADGGLGEFDDEAWSDDSPESDADADSAPAAGRGGYSAVPPDAKQQRGGLRDVFRRLVHALHPDRAKDAADQQRRTAVMKELTRAYEAGDLAALLRAEREYLEGGNLPNQDASVDTRVELLERAVDGLKEQLKRLRAELRELRRSEPVSFIESVRERARPGQDPWEEAHAAMQGEVDELAAIRDFVSEFRDGKLSLRVFLAGPFRFSADDAFESAQPRSAGAPA